MPAVSLRDAIRFWLKLGFINFGGPTGQIAIMHQELVEKRRWISEARFLHALNYCMLLPGPEAQQLAVYIGWLLHRTLGGLIAGVLFILPGALVMFGLTWSYAAHGNVAWVAAVFAGLRAAVVAIVALAVLQLASKALKNMPMKLVALAAFVAIFAFKAPFPLIVVTAGTMGFLAGKAWPRWFQVTNGHSHKGARSAIDDDAPPPDHARPSLVRLVRCLALGLTLWIGPLLLVAWWRGSDDVLTQQALFFSKCSMVTFGGAYAVLAYISQAAVETFHWLTPGEMLDGLGLAESTPGPLILVTQFVGGLGASRAHIEGFNAFTPFTMALLGSLVTLWATFAPCFLWIFAGAPFIERTRGHVRLNAALSTITASVVGVVLNLSVWLGLQTLFRICAAKQFGPARLLVPDIASIDLVALAIAVAAYVALRHFKVGIIPVVFVGAAIGWLVHAAG